MAKRTDSSKFSANCLANLWRQQDYDNTCQEIFWHTVPCKIACCFYTCWSVHLRVKTRRNISVTEFWSYLIDFRCFFYFIYFKKTRLLLSDCAKKKRAFSQTLGDKLTYTVPFLVAREWKNITCIVSQLHSTRNFLRMTE